MCKVKPHANFDTLCSCLPILTKYLGVSDRIILSDICWAFSSLTDGSNRELEQVMEHNCLNRLVELLDFPSYFRYYSVDIWFKYQLSGALEISFLEMKFKHKEC